MGIFSFNKIVKVHVPTGGAFYHIFFSGSLLGFPANAPLHSRAASRTPQTDECVVPGSRVLRARSTRHVASRVEVLRQARDRCWTAGAARRAYFPSARLW